MGNEGEYVSWRFRRSTKIGPFRLTATKRGFSTSVGVPGARIGINTKGQVRATGGIPGTGIYDTEIIGHVGAAKGTQKRVSRDYTAPGTDETIIQIAPGARNLDAVVPKVKNGSPGKTDSRGKTVAIVIMAIVIVGLLIVIGTR